VLSDVLRCVDRLIQRDKELTQLVNVLREHDQSSRLHHYTGHEVDYILRLLTDQPRLAVTSSVHPRKSRDSGIPPVASSDNDVITVEETPPSLDVFRKAARGLHYVSIAILSFLLLEVQLINRYDINNNNGVPAASLT